MSLQYGLLLGTTELAVVFFLFAFQATIGFLVYASLEYLASDRIVLALRCLLCLLVGNSVKGEIQCKSVHSPVG